MGSDPEKTEDNSILREKKLEVIGILASSIAHDLNNLLTGILGHVSYLRLAADNNKAQLDSITAIEDGARRAAQMTQQILEFTRGGQLEHFTVNLSLLVAANINLIRASLPNNVILRSDIPKEDIFIYGDESQLSQLVTNILVNARDALPDGGVIEVLLESVRFAEGVNLRQEQIPAGDYVKLCIKDNGVGIPASLQGKIFEPFFTTKSQYGTGLGLATVSSIVKAHRGALALNSQEGKGTCFEIFLPSVVDCAADSRCNCAQKPPLGVEKILVVDDEEAVRTVIQRSLEHLGYQVVVAGDGREALKIFSESADEFDLIVLDMIMPLIPGDELFFELRRRSPDAAVLIASGYSSDNRTRTMLEHGALGFIQKPFAVEDLALEVRRCLDIAAQTKQR